MNISYERTFYASKRIKAATKRFLKALPEEVNFLVSTGSSGCAIASAMLVTSARSLRHVVIRKDSEQSHGSSRIWEFPQNPVGAFVDDFISTGNTANAVLKQCKEKVKYVIVGTSDFSPNGNKPAMDKVANRHNVKIILVK